jgi:hypothetical protein
MTVSPIITRGMGTNQALVTQGFRPAVVVVVAEKIEKRRRRGEDDADDDSDYDEYKISAFLVEVNGKEFENPIISKVEKIFETHVKTKVDAVAVTAEAVVRAPKKKKVEASAVLVEAPRVLKNPKYHKEEFKQQQPVKKENIQESRETVTLSSKQILDLINQIKSKKD